MRMTIVGATCALLVAGAAAGCAPSGGSTTSDAKGGDAASLAAAYPEHQRNTEDGGAGMASFHAALGYECADCHTGDLQAEVAGLAAADGAEPALASSYYMDSETCLSCHGGTWEELAKLTDGLGDYNPHDSIHGTIENCNECHKGHSDQVDVCSECHDNGGQTMKGMQG